MHYQAAGAGAQCPTGRGSNRGAARRGGDLIEQSKIERRHGRCSLVGVCDAIGSTGGSAMLHHFHRCAHLMLEVDASEFSHNRKGGAQILEEFCDAKRLARCVGLAECDVSPSLRRKEGESCCLHGT
jgi:hypothetical protein